LKFIYSDTMDHVDPDYDFVRDEFGADRRKGVTDRYAHQMLTPAPYDGLLVAMSGVKDGRYSEAAQQRLLRDGVRKFLNFDGPAFADKMMMGDCGAFAYAMQDVPPYTIEELVDFYVFGQFTHGCALDHIIFDFDTANPSRDDMPQAVQARYELTLQNAKKFLDEVRRQGNPFVPIGVVQGWSPASMADAARQLVAMGYTYLAIGGLVPLKSPQIHECLKALRRVVPDADLHLLGFAKAESIHEFLHYGITSFDSTSPLIRAFKDARANYYVKGADGLEYYMALRVPQALENAKLMQSTKRGTASPEKLLELEAKALGALREYDQLTCTVDAAHDALDAYLTQFYQVTERDPNSAVKKLEKARPLMRKTLEDRPWANCACAICRQARIEVVIFRSSNRNKRRGMHNLGVFHDYLKTISARATA
jgi:hypothetical protein